MAQRQHVVVGFECMSVCLCLPLAAGPRSLSHTHSQQRRSLALLPLLAASGFLYTLQRARVPSQSQMNSQSRVDAN